MGYGGGITYTDMGNFYHSRSNIKHSVNASEVFKSRDMNPLFDPSKMKLPREACDSASCPKSRGIIIAEDVSGSMGRFPLSLIKNEFPRLAKYLYENNLSFNPHVMVMGIDDVAAGNPAALQATQFESDIRILEQLEQLYLEGGGGGNDSESYALAWYFAGKFVEMDCYNKRGEKGFLFTFGDEGPTPSLCTRELKTVFGSNDPNPPVYLTSYDCLEMASTKFNCYHIIPYTSYFKGYSKYVLDSWRKLMGKNRVCPLEEHECLPELISTILKMHDGYSKTEALAQIHDTNSRYIVSDSLKYHEENIKDATTSENHNFTDNIDIF